VRPLIFILLTASLWISPYPLALLFGLSPGHGSKTESFIRNIEEITATVAFSHAAGFYGEEFALALSSADPGATILYTLDGSEPLVENLAGKTYQYKNHYPANEGESFGEFITAEIRSYTYVAPLRIYDRSNEPDALTGISSTYYSNSAYAPDTPTQKATVVRARLIKEGFDPGPVTTHTYFIGADNTFTIPVVALSLDEDIFFDYEKGCYVAGKDFDDWRAAHPRARTDGFSPCNYQRDEEHPAHLEIFDGAPMHRVLDQNIGIKLAGNVSLYYPEKSIRLFARSEYGNSQMAYQFFPGLPDKEYKRITLRNSGNDNGHTMFRDAAIHESVKHLNFGTQAYRPAVVFLNGEYWGIHNMREHLDKNYLKARYNADPDNVDLLELSEIKEGDQTHYTNLKDYLQAHDLSEPDNYAYVTTQIDPDNFTDYQIAQIFAANTDWPGKNIRYWRARTDVYQPDAPPALDGRWRWLMKDTDFGFGLVASAPHNTLAFATDPDEETMPNPAWSTLLLRKLLENPDYKEKFVSRFADLLNTAFQPGRLVDVIEQMQTVIAPEMPRHISRWNAPESMDEWDRKTRIMKEFVKVRQVYQREHIAKYFKLVNMFNLSVEVSDAAYGYVRVNTLDILETTAGVQANPYPWTGVYFQGIPVTVTAIPNPGHKFVSWSGGELPDTPVIKLDLTEDISLTAEFAKASDVAVGVSEGTDDISFYPNPGQSQVIIGFPTPGEVTRLELYDLTGRLIQTITVSPAAGRVVLNVSGHPKGIYLVHVIKHDNTRLTKRLAID
jgi:hypothetical protein